MRLLIFTMLTVAGVVAHADYVQCSDVTNTSHLVYDANSNKMAFVKPNTRPGASGISITKLDSLRGATEDYTLHIYALADEQTVGMTWVSSGSEIERGLRGHPTQAWLRNADGIVTEHYKTCRWVK